MNLYLTGSGGLKSYLDLQKLLNPPRLFSYYNLVTKNVQYGEAERFKDLLKLKKGGKKMAGKKVKLFLDSGAYSAWSKGVPINLQEYIQYIKTNLRFIEHYSVLDVMGDAEATLKNQKAMEKAGLKPIPCFHYGEDEKYLKQYANNYPYISLGGMVPVSTGDLQMWLDRMFRDYICGTDGMPKCKVHGFGMTTHELMWRYPWYSLDSASWVFAGRNGVIMVPRKSGDGYDYRKRPWTVTVSEKSGEAKKIEGKHFNSFSKTEQEQIVGYLSYKGYELGKSDFENSAPDSELRQNQRWANKEKTKVETIVVDGVKTSYRIRDALNVAYYVDLMDAFNRLAPWPWAFKSAPAGFGMGRGAK